MCLQVTSPDVNLVLKLQQKLKEVEGDRDRLERRLERLEQGTPDSENKQAHDQIRVGGETVPPGRGWLELWFMSLCVQDRGMV